METKEFEKSLAYARQLLQAAREAKRPTQVYFGYRMIYQSFNAAHRYDSALHYHLLATSLNDSLTNINRTEQVLDLQYRYETAKKELDCK